MRQKQSSAEEPVTARIGRRTEAVHVSDPAIKRDDAASTEGTPSGNAGTAQDLSIKPQMTFQERIAMERQPAAGSQ